MKKSMRVHYDEEGDFLEISIGQPSNCYAKEIERGIFLRIDEATGQVRSIGILSFKERSKKLQDVSLDLPIEVKFSNLMPLKQSA